MDPETRTLIQVMIEDGAKAERRVTTLMGDKVEPRRRWIEKNVQFSLDEDSSILESTEPKATLKEVKPEGENFQELSLFD